jgi:hypothetical protein
MQKRDHEPHEPHEKNVKQKSNPEIADRVLSLLTVTFFEKEKERMK